MGPVAEIGAGGGFTCALADGAVWCWGWNNHGQLGREDGSALVPGPVEGLQGVVDLAVGDTHACVRLGDGSIVCWGDNERGQLGDGTRRSSSRPVAVQLPPAAIAPTPAEA